VCHYSCGTLFSSCFAWFCVVITRDYCEFSTFFKRISLTACRNRIRRYGFVLHDPQVFNQRNHGGNLQSNCANLQSHVFLQQHPTECWKDSSICKQHRHQVLRNRARAQESCKRERERNALTLCSSLRTACRCSAVDGLGSCLLVIVWVISRFPVQIILVFLVEFNFFQVVRSTPNAGCPLTTEGVYPLLVADIWEHSYYLDHQNRRVVRNSKCFCFFRLLIWFQEYLQTFWDMINWEKFEKRFLAAAHGELSQD
jgi:hypothetical protein